MADLLDNDPYAGLIADVSPVSGVDAPSGTAEFVCIECGTPLHYSGRGRHPKYCDDHKPGPQRVNTGTRTVSAKGDVETALAAMDMLYSGMTMLLLVISPEASAQFASKIGQAQMQNRLAFEGDKSLTKAVCKTSSKGGKAVFVSTQVMLFAPVAQTVVKDMAARKPRPVLRSVPSPTNVAPAQGSPIDNLRTGGPAPTSPPNGEFVDPVDADRKSVV